MYSDKESYLWYVKRLQHKPMPREFIIALRSYLLFELHMKIANKKYKK